MAKHEIFTVKGTAIFCNSRKPISRDAKFHRGQFCIQAIVNANDLPDAVRNCQQVKPFTTDILPEGEEYTIPENPVLLALYSNFPIQMFDEIGQDALSGEIENINNGELIEVAIKPYENNQGLQLGINAVCVAELKEHVKFNPFKKNVDETIN